MLTYRGNDKYEFVKVDGTVVILTVDDIDKLIKEDIPEYVHLLNQKLSQSSLQYNTNTKEH